jgi:hypothetical protein
MVDKAISATVNVSPTGRRSKRYSDESLERSFPGLVIPEGLTFDDLDDAQMLVDDWEESHDPSSIHLVIQIFEFLTVRRRDRLSKIDELGKVQC